jgi:hypothetical protein
MDGVFQNTRILKFQITGIKSITLPKSPDLIHEENIT